MKMKSKKMTKSTFAIIIMAVVMVAMLAFGGTYAYFTASATTKTGTTTTGVIALETTGNTITISKQNVLPHENLLTEAEATAITYSAAKATRAQVAFFTVKVEITKNDTAVTGATLTLTLPTVEGKVMDGAATGTTQKFAVLVPAAGSVAMTGLQVAFDATANSDNGTIPDLMGATVTITIEAKSVQAVLDNGTEVTAETLEANLAALKANAGIA